MDDVYVFVLTVNFEDQTTFNNCSFNVTGREFVHNFIIKRLRDVLRRFSVGFSLVL